MDAASRYRAEGAPGFFRGLYPGLLACGQGAVQFAVYEALRPTFAHEAVAHLVHSTQPPRHLVVNMSLTMRAASLSPQPVLDFFVRRQFGEAGG